VDVTTPKTRGATGIDKIMAANAKKLKIKNIL
jgi:hypothetical protein